MKLIVIYGPTAAGKHTVGSKLSELTGYKFFYNHLTVDVVRPLYGDDHDPRRTKLLSTLRLDVLEAMARDGIDTIFTVAYIPNIDPGFIPRIIKAVTKHGGTLHFVRLTPPDATLFDRIDNQSRHKLNKPTDSAHLRDKLTNYDCRAVIDYPSTMNLDTSQLSPLESAHRIIKEFGLETV